MTPNPSFDDLAPFKPFIADIRETGSGACLWLVRKHQSTIRNHETVRGLVTNNAAVAEKYDERSVASSDERFRPLRQVIEDGTERESVGDVTE